MRLPLRITLVVAVTAIVMGLMPSAWACSCVGGMTSEQYLEASNAAFVGVARDRAVVRESDAYREPGEVRYAFDVEEALKGSLGSRIDVSSHDASSTCGFRFTVGNRYRVYLYETESGDYATGLCSGNEDLGAAGTPATPVPEASKPPSPKGSRGSTPNPSVAPTSGSGGSGSEPGATPTVGGVAVGERNDPGPGGAGGTSLAVPLGIITAGLVGGAIVSTLRRRRL